MVQELVSIDPTPPQSMSEIKKNQCIRGVDAVRNFVLQGWMLMGIWAPNFILTGEPGSQTVVLISFYGVEPSPAPDQLSGFANIQAETFFFMVVDLVLDDFYPDIVSWGEKNIQHLDFSDAS